MIIPKGLIMRLPAVVIAIAMLIVVLLTPAQAQSSFGVGFYEFEDTIAGMSYTGTWSTYTSVSGTLGGTGRTTSGAGASVSFIAGGPTVVIWRVMRSSGSLSKMNVCINGGSCVLFVNESASSTAFLYPLTITVSPGATVSVTQTSGQLWLDSFMILSDVAASIPTPVPTATIIPSSTPASTTTPQPTPTPQPTATAYTLPGAMIMIDPARSYGDQNGQITATEYSATAADIHLSNLLSLIFFSMWGMFLFAVFVLIRYREKGKPK
jgi:uncharacterized membrane protein